MRTIHRDIACAIIESADGKILLGRKDPEGGGIYVDRWHIPGGGVEEGESLEEAVRTQLMEDVSFDSSGASLKLVDDLGSAEAEKLLETDETVLCHMRFFVFLARSAQVASAIPVKAGDDFVSCRWFSKDEIPVEELVPAGISLFRRLGYISSSAKR